MFGKTDSSNAFRLVPLLVAQHYLLVMMCIHPKTGEKCFFIDKCLPFGSSRSCTIFQEFSDALAYIAKMKIRAEKIARNPALSNYLDDFLFIVLKMCICSAMLKEFLSLCHTIGCPISEEKMETSTEIIVFLGILLNGRLHVVSIPQDKVIKALNLIQEVIELKKVTIKTIQQLTGTLNFLNRAIVLGRAFTRNMYTKLKITNSKGHPLKQHHHVRLGHDFIQDCKMWQMFLNNVDKTQLCRWFEEFRPHPEYQVLNFYSDASLNENLRYGAIFNDSWIVGQ